MASASKKDPLQCTSEAKIQKARVNRKEAYDKIVGLGVAVQHLQDELQEAQQKAVDVVYVVNWLDEVFTFSNFEAAHGMLRKVVEYRLSPLATMKTYRRKWTEAQGDLENLTERSRKWNSGDLYYGKDWADLHYYRTQLMNQAPDDVARAHKEAAAADSSPDSQPT